MKRTIVVAVCLLAAVALAVTGCTRTAPGPGQPEPKISKDIVLAMNTEIRTLDPHKSNDGPSILTWNFIYNTLVDLDIAKGTIVPALAESWTHPDETTIRFNLRRGVKFHDGTELKASDVVFSIKRLIDPATASPAAYLLNVISEVKADDDYTVTVKLKNPFSPIMFHFSHPAASIVPEAAVKALGEDFARKPVGSGPFKFVDHVKGDRVEFARFEGYWGGAPVPEKVTVRIIPEPSTQVAELEAGGVHLAFNIPTHEVARLQDTKGIEVLTVMGWSISGFTFNLQRQPFGDVRVRQALNYALDKEAIVEHVERGLGIPAAQILSPVVFGYDPDLKPYPYDVAKAKQLLAEAGYPNGFQTRLLVWNIERFVRFAEAVQAQLAKVGVDAKLDIIEFGTALDMAYRGDFDISIMGWGTPTLDGDYTMYALMHSDNWGPAGNWGFYRNDEVDRLIVEARTTTDIKVREAAYHRASALILQDAPWIFSHHPMVAYAKRSTLKDVEVPISYIYTNLLKAYVQEDK
ncbi:MAG: ABC transporter substrate-binding protein [Bacillota bacterium]